METQDKEYTPSEIMLSVVTIVLIFTVYYFKSIVH